MPGQTDVSLGDKGRERLEQDLEEEGKALLGASITCWQLTIHHETSSQHGKWKLVVKWYPDGWVHGDFFSTPIFSSNVFTLTWSFSSFAHNFYRSLGLHKCTILVAGISSSPNINLTFIIHTNSHKHLKRRKRKTKEKKRNGGKNCVIRQAAPR